MARDLRVRGFQFGRAFKIVNGLLRVAQFEMDPAKRINKKAASGTLFDGALNQADCLIKVAAFIRPPIA